MNIDDIREQVLKIPVSERTDFLLKKLAAAKEALETRERLYKEQWKRAEKAEAENAAPAASEEAQKQAQQDASYGK